MMGTVDKNFRPTKQRRYEEEYEPNSISNQLREAGGFGESPMLSFLEVLQQKKWSEADDAKYIGGGMPAARLPNPQPTQTAARPRDIQIESTNNLEAASDYGSKKQGTGGKKKGSSKRLKITKNKSINTPTNSQGGINI